MNPATFADHKKDLLEELDRIRTLTVRAEEISGIEATSILTKIHEHSAALAVRRFTVVLFGAFSDGKTTVVSALTDRLGLSIGPAPTTDCLQTYDYGDVVLVDVPGLFSDQERHDALTRAYISEASLLLIVLEAVNPLKASHHEALRWLLSDIGKASSAIFVLNKMDEVADLEDKDEFDGMAAVKIGVVRGELSRIGLADVASLPVVCVAADPAGKGQAHWRSNADEYDRLSRMGKLRSTVDERIGSAREELEVTAGMAGVREAIRLLGSAIAATRRALSTENDLLVKERDEIRKRLRTLEEKMASVNLRIHEDKRSLQQEHVQAIGAARDLAALATLINVRIGKQGEIIAQSLALLVQKHTATMKAAQDAFADEIEESATFFAAHYRKVADLLGKAGGTVGKTSAKQFADALLKARDALKLPIKFKPWGALKWGKWLKGAGSMLAVFGTVLESLETVVDVVSHVLLIKRKDEVTERVTELFDQFDATLAAGIFEAEYFPAVLEARKVLAAADCDVEASTTKIERLREIERELGSA